MYFNYHGKAKRLIRQGNLISYKIVGEYNGIRPALVLYFDCHIPMPIREKKFEEYLLLLEELSLTDKIIVEEKTFICPFEELSLKDKPFKNQP